MYVKLQVKESSIEIRKFPETRAMKSRQIMYNRPTVSNSRYSRNSASVSPIQIGMEINTVILVIRFLFPSPPAF